MNPFTYFKHLTSELNRMTVAIDNLTAAVAAQTPVVQQLVQVIAQLRATPNDPAIQAAADAIVANTAQLSSAVAG